MIRMNPAEAPEVIYVAESIHNGIPKELINNIVIEGSSLGGAVTISFWSNLHTNITYKENSKHSFRIMIHFTNERNEPTRGVAIDMWRKYGIIKPLRGNKQGIGLNKAIEKIVKYINSNKDEFMEYVKAGV